MSLESQTLTARTVSSLYPARCLGQPTDQHSLAAAIPASADAFKADCATVGKTARCCVIPVVSRLSFERVFMLSIILTCHQAGQDVLCTTPQGL